jgi:murein DD-endopeptidase MepM/ murein hydrolase activator NlpD
MTKIQWWLFGIVLILIVAEAFLIGFLIQRIEKNKDIALLNSTVANKDEQIYTLSQKAQEYEQQYTLTQGEVESLEGRVAGLSTELTEVTTKLDEITTTTTDEYPFAVPTTGIVATFPGTYGGNMRGIEHWGIDIWTTTKNNGITPDYKGNAVYSVCDGRVTKLLPGNGAFRVLCDDIPEKYQVPAHTGVYVYYGHMGHATNGNLFFDLREGQRLTKGQFLGYQGNVSDVFPNTRNVHLHLTIWSGRYQPIAETGGPHNPCLYFGGDCTRPGSRFEAE